MRIQWNNSLGEENAPERSCLLIISMTRKVAKVAGETPQEQKVHLSVDFRSMMALGKQPWVFVCAKSNFNLELLIDVAFYFKCLWKYPTTVLCGPLSNESRTPPVAIRSLASTVFIRLCGFWKGEHMAGLGHNKWVSLRFGDHHICGRGCHGRLPVPALGSTGQLCWCCQPHPPPVHLLWATWAPTEGFRRISTPEEGVKGSGASVQGSACGFTFDLPSSTNECALMYYFDLTGLRWYEPQFFNLSSVICSHKGSQWGFCLSEGHNITWVWSFPVQCNWRESFRLFWFGLTDGGLVWWSKPAQYIGLPLVGSTLGYVET